MKKLYENINSPKTTKEGIAWIVFGTLITGSAVYLNNTEFLYVGSVITLYGFYSVFGKKDKNEDK